MVLFVITAVPVRAEMAATDSLAICDARYSTGDVTASEEIARSILQREPASYVASWKLARALISSANLENDRKKSRRIFEEAMELSRQAIDLNPEGTSGYTCLAICAGKLSDFESGGDKIEMAEMAREAARKAIELDDRNDLAYLVLGVWNREIATVGGMTKLAAKVFYGGIPEGASLENSEARLRKAVNLAPEFLNHHRELAITLLEMDRLEEAVAELEIAVGLGWKQPQDEKFAENALELLEEARLELEESRSRNW
jgi:tetratricopeptide (TPR) repeat protein